MYHVLVVAGLFPYEIWAKEGAKMETNNSHENMGK
jgi:hypothetical protein